MRIAIANWTSRSVGGAEEYLTRLVPNLIAHGHEIGMWYEDEQPRGGKPLAFDEQVTAWHLMERGESNALRDLADWHPDVVYVNGLSNVHLHAKLRSVAPGVLSIHAYAGTCISGNKSYHAAVPCRRRFGAACLALYFPYRCGGLNPATMVREFVRQKIYLAAIRQYEGVVVHSSHMQMEYTKHGVRTDRVHLPLMQLESFAATPHHEEPVEGSRRLLFLGRLSRLKGGHQLLDALSIVASRTNAPINLTIAGDGDERAAWERAADALPSSITTRFVGWVTPDERERLLRSTDLLVVPSVWPEPFAMVGLEAASHGIPAVAFDVGGIRDWLRDGESGAVAPGDPPTARGLADAILRVLESRETLARLGAGAGAVYGELSRIDSAAELLAVLERVRARRAGAARIG